MRMTGMPVHIATTWAMSSSSTVGLVAADTCACQSFRSVSTRLAGGRLGSRRRRRQLVLLAGDRRVLLLRDPLQALRASRRSGGADERRMRTRLAASSIRSIALSGRKRSVT